MRIILVTQNAPVYVGRFFEEFLGRALDPAHEIDSAVILPAVSPRGVLYEVRRRLRYYGPADFARLVGKILSERAHAVRPVMARHAIPVNPRFPPGDVRSEGFAAYLREQAIDLLVSVACPRILPPRVLEAPRAGGINYHTSLLPAYRGREPLFWALRHGENEVGISVHEMDAKLDNGPIVAQRRTKVDPSDSLDALYEKTVRIGAHVLAEAIEKIQDPDSVRLPNVARDSTVFGFPGPADVRAFRAAGRRFF